MPAFSIILPLRIKNGIANRTNLLLDEDTNIGTTLITVSRGRVPASAIIVKILDIPRQIAIGVPINKNTAKEVNKIIDNILHHLLLSLFL